MDVIINDVQIQKEKSSKKKKLIIGICLITKGQPTALKMILMLKLLPSPKKLKRSIF